MRLKKYLIYMVLSLSGNVGFSQINNFINDSLTIKNSVAEIRQHTIGLLANRDLILLKNYLSDSLMEHDYKKFMLFTQEERPMLRLLSDNFSAAIKEKRKIANITYEKNVNGEKRFFRKIYPPDDTLKILLDTVFAEQYAQVIKNITSANMLSDAEKDLLLIEANYYHLLIAPYKKQPLKQLDVRLNHFHSKYKHSIFCDRIYPVKRYSNWFHRGAFWGVGIGTGRFNNGVQKIFRSPVSLHGDLDLYHDRIGSYGFFNISSFKTKVDTAFRQVTWPAKTRNYFGEAQMGVSLIAVRSNHVRCILKTGLGIFCISANNIKQIKLKKIPYVGLGGCIDICNFNKRFIKNNILIPAGIRLFYQYDILSFKKKYPEFPTNFQSYGVQFGLML